jgi:ATP-binding cassette subfamily B protein
MNGTQEFNSKKVAGIDLATLFAAPSLLGFFVQHIGLLRTFIGWRAASILVVVPFPFIAQRIIDDAVPTQDHWLILKYTGVGLALLAIHILAMRQAVRHLSEHIQRLVHAMRARIFQKLQFVHFGFLDSTKLGRMLSKYAIDTQNIEQAAIVIVNNIIWETARAVLLIALLTWMDPWLLVFVLLMLPILFWVRRVFFKRILEANRSVRLAREKLTGHANEFISATKLIRGFGEEGRVSNELDATSDHYKGTRLSQMQVNQTMNYLVFSVFTGVNLLSISFAAFLVVDGVLSFGKLVALVAAMPVIMNPINLFAQISIQYFQGRESYRSIKELVDSGYVEQWKGKQRLDPLRGKVEFRKVTFHYNKNKPAAIKELDLSIEAGKHAAFVGPSGSGKSTLVNLILGLYAPDKGEICIDGVSQSELDMRALRRQCAIVMQDNLLLSGSILDNLRFGRPQATEAEATEAARQANALEFIKELPDGLMTLVGERGVSLSGGQRQRIAIARALLRDPQLLILDEATSALDYSSEAVVQEAIDRLVEGRTTITIAHRLSTIRNADCVYVLKEGVLVQSGAYSELEAAKGSAFAELLSKVSGQSS